MGNDYQVVAIFPSAVTMGGVSVMSRHGLAGATATAAGSVVTINLTAVADAQTLAITLLDLSDGTTTGLFVIPMAVLIGNTNGSASVGASDIAQTKSSSGQAASAGNFRSDVSANGVINGSDIGLIKSESGSTLP